MKLKKFIKNVVVTMSLTILNVVGSFSRVDASPVPNGFYLKSIKGFCPYYGLQIYSDVYNKLNKALVECNGAAGWYAVALWPSLAHSDTNFGIMSDGSNKIYTVANPNAEYLGKSEWYYNVADNSVIEADINFNMCYPFDVDGSSSAYDMISVLTHELGHVMGLDHDSNKSAVMYSEFGMGEIRRSFLQSEKDALYNIYH